MLLSQYATQRTQEGQPLQLSFLDITKAYFNGIPRRNLCLRLPPELGLPRHVVGHLHRCVYGTRDAASVWEDTYTSALEELGFVTGRASPCCFFHKKLQIRLVIHGDDFTALGTRAALDEYERLLKQKFELKVRGRLSSEADTDKKIRILNRIVSIDDKGVHYEADPGMLSCSWSPWA